MVQGYSMMLLSQERVRGRITQSKLALTVHGYNRISLRRNKTENRAVKNIVNGSHGTMLFSQEGVKLSITESNIALTVPRVQCYFPKKESDQDQ